jgi:hemoglobin-like flavoprotein
MDQEAERLVRGTWQMVEGDRTALARVFYRRLFEIAPEARALFGGVDLPAQERKFADMLDAILRAMDDPDAFTAELKLLGRRHAGYGVRDADYYPVGEALLGALEERLGSAFRHRERAAWREAYLLMAGVMMRAARGAGTD